MRVYAYGARSPIEGAELVREQLWLANIYHRVLVLLERRRRDVVERMYRQACPLEWKEYEAASKACIEAAQAVRMSRAKVGKPDAKIRREKRDQRKVAIDQLTDARRREIVARRAWKDARKKVTPKLRRRLKMIDTGVKQRQRFAYNAAGSVGLAWGTRLKIGESVERAAQMSAKVGSMPYLPRFDGSGAIVVQLQGKSGIGNKNGLAPKDAHAGSDTRFRLEYVDYSTWQMAQGGNAFTSKSGRLLPQSNPNSRRSQRRAANGGYYAITRIRIGSDGRAPIWAVWPVVVHRPLPADAPIKWASMHAQRIGPRIEWTLQLTVDENKVAARTKGSTLAVNLGWRSKPLNGGLRVAYAVGSDGYEEEVLVPTAYIAGVEHVESIHTIRDRIFNKAKKMLVKWIATTDVPDWLATEARYVDFWRTQRKLVRLMSIWSNRRFDGDDKMWRALVAWQKKDRHLWFWETDERTKLLRMRREFYRTRAARWATLYAKILVTDMDLRDFATAPEPEEGAHSEGKDQRVSQRLAAPSELRGAIKNACSTRGVIFEEVNGAFKSQTCTACGVVMAFAARQNIIATCGACGARMDQDERHCRNLLASVEAMRKKQGALAPSTIANVETQNGQIGRWQKRRSKTASEFTENKKNLA